MTKCLPSDVVAQVRRHTVNGASVRAVAATCGVSLSSVYKIISGVTHASSGAALRRRRARTSSTNQTRAGLRTRVLNEVILLPSGCWIWPSQSQPAGRATVRWDHRHRSVAGAVYEALVGPVPAGRRLSHRPVLDAGPDLRRCCRPDHQQGSTAGDTSLSPTTVLRTTEGTHCPRGHRYDVVNTRFRRTRVGGLTRCCRTCARLARTGLAGRMAPEASRSTSLASPTDTPAGST